MKFNLKAILVIFFVALLLCIILLGTILVIKSQLDINQLNQQISDLKTSTTPTATPAGGRDATITPTSDSVSTNDSVTVYFSKDPDSYSNSGDVVGVDRTSTSGSLYVFAMNQLLNGPTPAEQALGLFVPFSLSGTSNCGGAGYKIQKTDNNINLTFCKTVTEKIPNGGGFAGATLQAQSRALNVLSRTLKISGTEVITIRDMNGDCYAIEANADGTLNACSM